MRTIAFTNLKGGVGKSSVCYNLAISLANKGKRVLLVDMDFQGNLSHYFLAVDDDRKPIVYKESFNDEVWEDTRSIYEQSVEEGRSILNVLAHKDGVERMDLSEAVFKTVNDRIDIIPANITLEEVDQRYMPNLFGLKFALEQVAEEYDFCFIDTHPARGVCENYAVAAADMVIVPVQFDKAMFMGPERTRELANDLSNMLRLPKKECILLANRVNTRSNRDKYGLEVLADSDFQVFESFIRDNVKVGEATMFDSSVASYRKNKAAEDFEGLGEEVLTLCER